MADLEAVAQQVGLPSAEVQLASALPADRLAAAVQGEVRMKGR